MFTFQDIVHARDMMQGIVEQTPLIHSQTFSSLAENEVFLKLENLQKTGSFKVRGSYNKIYSLKKEELKHGVVAASAGNHAQGVAYAGSRIGIPCTIVMPEGAPLSKSKRRRDTERMWNCAEKCSMMPLIMLFPSRKN